MLTPYDWQEAIGHRAHYVESRLADGVPVLAASCKEGIVLLSKRRQGNRKVFEIYDRLAFAGIGLQSDIEAIRIAAIEFAHREGFTRSEEDVTVNRVVARLSSSIKRAFADFNTSPIVAACLFAEVGDKPSKDTIMVLEYDGDYQTAGPVTVLGGTVETVSRLREAVGEKSLESKGMEEAWKVLKGAFSSFQEPTAVAEEEWIEEAVLLSRDPSRENRFVSL